MAPDPLQALQAANRRPFDGRPSKGALLIAGATGVLGHELVRRLAGRHRFDHTYVLAREPIRDGLPGVETVQVPDLPMAQWPPVAARTALVLFEPPRLFYDRERALWTPEPAQLPALAGWLRSCGVQTLAVVLPHDQGRLPEALKRGLASLDEQAVVALGFERVLLVRSAQKPVARRLAHPAERLAAWMLSIARFMVPPSEQPARASKVAELVDVALALAPPGVHVAAPELVWRATQGELRSVVQGWVAAGP
ncbi:hypothetical protein [Variovorax ginsengisoli]|jgi:hypothetical protein|uniref:Uncharacterized protein n=1 Tax=Variovorax ginsengisoli TaxID=363844 RepID=A0ABT8S071_9BURK|nr:hypothetical protein [Variovorax ginsengisoli]MDN8613065.1 hypothetical protein [Variovorax ginsengisoli]MDO1532235.1 hypothetical protein [Variovorax ginsengisoli]HET7835395.1 hypothetical protein [Variovorax sp.]